MRNLLKDHSEGRLMFLKRLLFSSSKIIQLKNLILSRLLLAPVVLIADDQTSCFLSRPPLWGTGQQSLYVMCNCYTFGLINSVAAKCLAAGFLCGAAAFAIRVALAGSREVLDLLIGCCNLLRRVSDITCSQSQHCVPSRLRAPAALQGHDHVVRYMT